MLAATLEAPRDDSLTVSEPYDDNKTDLIYHIAHCRLEGKQTAQLEEFQLRWVDLADDRGGLWCLTDKFIIAVDRMSGNVASAPEKSANASHLRRNAVAFPLNDSRVVFPYRWQVRSAFELER